MLTVGPQTDTLLQIVHSVDVIHPVFVYNPEHNHTLQLPHIVAQLGFLGFIGLQRQFIDAIGKLLGSVAGEGGACGDIDTAKGLIQRHQAIGIDLAAVFTGDICNGGVHHRAEHTEHIFPQALTVQHLLPLGVNHLALGVHHIVIFQNALTGAEVPAFHAPLGIFHRIGEDFGINWGVLVQAKRVHQTHNPVRGEQTHQIVLQAEIELAFARIALTAGTATELVVDSTGLVTFCADDVQTASFPDLLGFVSHFGFVFGHQLGILLPNCQNFRVIRLRIGVSLGNELLGIALFSQFVQGHKFRVAAQHNICTTACHIGGDGHSAELTGLGNDLGFLLVELGVQHIMLDTGAL